MLWTSPVLQPALSITPMRVLSTVGRGSHHGLTTSPHLIPPLTNTRLCLLSSLHAQHQKPLLSGVPDYFDRTKILSGYDLSHYQVPHCIKSFLLFCLICVYSSQFSILFVNYVPIVTFWILTYHKIWILSIIFCFIWSYWIIYFLTCLEVFWSVVS